MALRPIFALFCAGLLTLALGPSAALASEFGPFSRSDLISHELADISPAAAQPFADALVRSERLMGELESEFRQQTPRRALVLYDGSTNAGLDTRAHLAAIMVRNLLGHFDLDVHMHRVNDYAPRQMESYDAIVYVGNVFGNELPAAFIDDALTTTKTLVWLQYNLSQIETSYPGALAARGILFEGSEQLPSGHDLVRPAFLDTVFYRGLPFRKIYTPPEGDGVASFDAELIHVQTQWPAVTRVEIGNPATGEVRPYIVQSGNFWFVADVPVSFAGVRERYMVFADLLHNMLGVDHPVQHHAMVRIEDLHPQVSLEGYRRLVALIESRDIPYSLAVIPEYRAVQDDGSVYSQPLYARSARAYRETLQRSMDRGAAVIMHGATHQYGDRPNPERGQTGIDYEFWDVVRDRPIDDDSMEWHIARLQRGIDIMNRAGFSTSMYEIPHYLGSPNSYLASRVFFPYTYQRVTYFGLNDPGRTPAGVAPVYEMQFFPYMIYQDHYGQAVIPENIGNLQYIPPAQSGEAMLRNAAYSLAVRDGVASLFIHSYLFVPYSGSTAYGEFASVIDGITEMGYEWVGVDEYLAINGLGPRGDVVTASN